MYLGINTLVTPTASFGMCGEACACLKASVFDGLASFAMTREDDYAPLLQDEHDLEAREPGKRIRSWVNLSNAIILLQSILIVAACTLAMIANVRTHILFSVKPAH